MPSPIYWLITNPSWLEKRNVAEVIADLRVCSFDPNESHNQIPLLRAFLQSWDHNPPENEVLEVAKLLVSRGADPKAAFELPNMQTVDRVQWGAMPAVRHFLRQAADGVEYDEVGHELFGNLRSDGTVDMVVGLVQSTLGKRKTPHAPIDGMHPGAWLCLHAVDLGEKLPGWCVPSRGYGADPARMARLAIRIAKDTVCKAGSPSKQDMFIGGLGLIAGVEFCHNNSADHAAREAGRKLGKKMLVGLDVEEQVRHFMSNTTRADHRGRMAGALFKAVGVMDLGEHQPWDILIGAWAKSGADALDLPQDGYRQLEHIGLPSRDQINHIPRTPRNQELLLDILAMSFSRFSNLNGSRNGLRLAYMDHIEQWRAGAGHLPDIEHSDLLARMGVNFNEQPGAEQALESLVLRVNSRPAAGGSPSRPRL